MEQMENSPFKTDVRSYKTALKWLRAQGVINQKVPLGAGLFTNIFQQRLFVIIVRAVFFHFACIHTWFVVTTVV